MIFTFAVIIWLGTTFPNYKEVNQSTKLQTSYLGKVGHVMEPVFLPMGVDWRVGVGFISAFAAREVFVGSMAIMFNITEENQDSQAEGLLKTMQEAKFSNGTPIFTLASVIGIIVFFMIALQCMSTFAIAVREQGKKFALQQLIIFNIVAYVLAVLVVNGLRAIGVA
jgi:ferrous iron transport protein B